MSRPTDFDFNAIPNFNAGGRLGELDPDNPEERQSSALADEPPPGADAQDGPAAAGEGDEMRGAQPRADADSVTPAPLRPAPGARVERDDHARGVTRVHGDNPEPLTQPPGGIDGLVGAP